MRQARISNGANTMVCIPGGEHSGAAVMRQSTGEALTALKDQIYLHCSVRAMTEGAALAVQQLQKCIRGETPGCTKQMKAH